jgi:hypothetical protein
MLALVIASTVAAAEAQADLGLSVVCLGYERPVDDHTAVMLGGGLFGTYFLPWFDRGDNVAGAMGDLRVSWFRGEDEHGLYVTPYLRAGYASAFAITGGVFVGDAFALSQRFDLRLGGGVQYLYVADEHASTPFVALDVTLGYRL